eukprot:gene1055-2632_t
MPAEAYATMMNNTMDDTAAARLADTLHLGALRYPGGTMSNIWDMEAGRYTPKEAWQDQPGYSEFGPFADDLPTQVIWDLNVYSLNSSEACDRIRHIASLGLPASAQVCGYSPPHLPPGVYPTGWVSDASTLMLEMGNEFNFATQGGSKFPNFSRYIAEISPVIACARMQSLAMAFLPLALAIPLCMEILPGTPSGAARTPPSRATPGLREHLHLFDAITMHEYSPSTTQVNALPEEDRIPYVASYSYVALKAMSAQLLPWAGQYPFCDLAVGSLGVASVRRDACGIRLAAPSAQPPHCPAPIKGNATFPIWATEYNYGLMADVFLPELEHGALHGIFHVSRVMAAVSQSEQYQAMIFQTLVHPDPPPPNHIFHKGTAIALLAEAPDRPDLCQISGTAQVASHVFSLAKMSKSMHAVTAAGSALHPISLWKTMAVPCLQACAFSSVANGSAAGVAWSSMVILNSCDKPVAFATTAPGGLQGPGNATVTTYYATDP